MGSRSFHNENAYKKFISIFCYEFVFLFSLFTSCSFLLYCTREEFALRSRHQYDESMKTTDIRFIVSAHPKDYTCPLQSVCLCPNCFHFRSPPTGSASCYPLVTSLSSSWLHSRQVSTHWVQSSHSFAFHSPSFAFLPLFPAHAAHSASRLSTSALC